MAALLESRGDELTPWGLIEVIQQAITSLVGGEQSPWRQPLLSELVDRAIAERQEAALAALALLEDLRSERDQARAELRKVTSQRSRPRGRVGRAPFGYRVGSDHELVPDPEQQTTIRQILRLRADGKSLREIAEVLAKGGVTVSAPTIARIIKDVRRNLIFPA